MSHSPAEKPKTILFVCTGNICRSPLAEYIFRQLTKGREDLMAASAGLGAIIGRPMSDASERILRQRGMEPGKFRSRPVTEEMVQEASLIFAMTQEHLDDLADNFPAAADKSFLLREFDPTVDEGHREIDDPFGGSFEEYEKTAREIEAAMPSVLRFIEFQDKKQRTTQPSETQPFTMTEAATQEIETLTTPTPSPMGYNRHASLAEVDPEIAEVVLNETARQQENIELIASENFTSAAVMEAQGSVLTNKYAEGYPGARWYGGCEHVDVAEKLAIERLKQLFPGAEHANVQPHSGSQANTAVYFAVLNPGDKILTMDLSHGGHLTHGHKANLSGKLYEVTHYGVDPETHLIDYDELAKTAEEVKPKMITAGASAYPRIIDWKRMREIADSVGAYLFTDIAHISGLVAGGVHPSPVGLADFVTSTTHKSLRGPRGGIILCKEEYAKKIDSRVFPCIQGGPLMHVVAAKAVCFKEALDPGFRVYQQQVVNNAKALAARLMEHGHTLVSGGTDNHLMLVDLRPKGLNGLGAQEALDRAGITVNKNSIPFDTEPIKLNGGIRIGTPAVTTRGMKEPEMVRIADLIHRVLSGKDDAGIEAQVREGVLELNREFPL